VVRTVTANRLAPGARRIEGRHAISELLAEKAYPRPLSPTCNQPFRAQLSTVIRLEVVLVRTTVPLIDRPAGTRSWSSETRTSMGADDDPLAPAVPLQPTRRARPTRVARRTFTRSSWP
jgi:hypothetical protein